MRKTLPMLAVAALLLAACSSQESAEQAQNTTPPSTTASSSIAPTKYSLSDTVNLHGVIISDLELTQEGCEITGTINRDLVAFQLVATVENTTPEEIVEALWSSEISFTDADGFKVEKSDLTGSDASMWCENALPQEFNNMAAGEKRRAAIQLTAPANAVEMTYNTMIIPAALPTTWDIEEELSKLTVTPASRNETAITPAAPEISATPTIVEETAAPLNPQSPVIGMTEAPGHAQPSTMNKAIESCGDSNLYQKGTTFFTDGTTGWTEQCAGEQ